MNENTVASEEMIQTFFHLMQSMDNLYEEYAGKKAHIHEHVYWGNPICSKKVYTKGNFQYNVVSETNRQYGHTSLFKEKLGGSGANR